MYAKGEWLVALSPDNRIFSHAPVLTDASCEVDILVDILVDISGLHPEYRLKYQHASEAKKSNIPERIVSNRMYFTFWYGGTKTGAGGVP